MRQRRRSALFLMLLLALGVATLKTPEVFDSGDDVSNDGEVLWFESDLPDLASRTLDAYEFAPPRDARPVAFGNVSKKHFWFGPTLDASSKAGTDILLFLSTQKK